MKAVILAGGLGTRLQPLTVNVPKPMLPLANKPFIEYVIELLKRHGIDEIILSTGHLPKAFQSHLGEGVSLGVKLTHVVEDVPLGTGGAVKNVEQMLDGTFIVFNGDILTDLNISQLIEYHQSKGAIATLALTSVDDPTAYGLVPLDTSGRVESFIEKPSWDEVTTDLVNAGTYVLEPEVLKYVPEGEGSSFERDLFPTLLKKKKPIFGFPTGAYWLDCGTPEKYLQAHHDVLEGEIGVDFEGEQIRPRVWVGEGSKIDPKAMLFGPVVVGKNCSISAHARLSSHTTVGDDCQIESGVVLEDSVLFDGCKLDRSSVVKKSILGRKVRIGKKVHVEELAVMGDNAVIGDENQLKKGIKIWSEVELGKGVVRF